MTEVRVNENGSTITCRSKRGITWLRVEAPIVRWLNERDAVWLWRADFDYATNTRFANFTFEDANLAMLFKLTWGGL